MAETVAAAAGSIGAWLLTYLLHSTVAIGSAWILVRAGVVRAPSGEGALWKAALLAGVVGATAVVVKEAPRPREVEVRGWVAERPVSAPEAVGTLLLQKRETEPLQFRSRIAPERGFRWDALFGGLWVFGVVVGLVRGAHGRRLLREGLAPMRPAGPRGWRALGRLHEDAHRVRDLLVSPHAESPCVIGSSVVLPERCERDLSDDELEAVLAHEIGHLALRDPLWLAVADGLVRVFWLQPLNRVVRDRLLDASELACDDWAVARLSRPVHLARSISRVAEWSRPDARTLPATALARSRSSLSERVRRILRGEGGTRHGRFLGVVLGATVVMSTLMLPPVTTARRFEAIIVRREGLGPPASAPLAGTRRVRVEVRALDAR